MTERREAPKTLPGWVWGGLFGCMVIMSWMGWNKYGPVSEAEVARLAVNVGGADVVNVVRNAERVYATRIQIRGKKDYWESLDDFEAISEPVLLDESDRNGVKALLASPRSYDLDAVSCRPRWGFRLRFVTGEDAINVWVCLECHHMLFQRDGKEGGGGALFHPMKRQIGSLARRLFPGDAAIDEAAR